MDSITLRQLDSHRLANIKPDDIIKFFGKNDEVYLLGCTLGICGDGYHRIDKARLQTFNTSRGKETFIDTGSFTCKIVPDERRDTSTVCCTRWDHFLYPSVEEAENGYELWLSSSEIARRRREIISGIINYHKTMIRNYEKELDNIK